MFDQTTPSILQRSAWIVDTLSREKYVSYAELRSRWTRLYPDDIKGFSFKTFSRNLEMIASCFGVIISRNHQENGYQIKNEQLLYGEEIRKWMLNTLTVNAALMDAKCIYNRILLHEIPVAGETLRTIIKAMVGGHRLFIRYQKFDHEEIKEHLVDPYLLKCFKQRWYILAHYDNGYVHILALDRMREVTISDETFKMPENYYGKDFFDDAYGIFVDESMEAEDVVLRAYDKEQFYMETKPMHPSQKELPTRCKHPKFRDFKLHLKPTDDFITDIASRGQWLEVRSPKWFRDKVRDFHLNALKKLL